MKTRNINLRHAVSAASRAALALIACALAAASLSAQPQPVNLRTVQGKAVATTGAPVPNVKVTVTARGRWTGEGWTYETQGTWTATSGADGAFRIEIPALTDDHSALRFSVSVEPPEDGALAPAALIPPAGLQAGGKQAQDITVLFAPATTRLTGTVRDDAGNPVPGAVVKLDLGNWFTATATANEQGAYEFPRLAFGQYKVASVDPPPGSPLIRLYTSKPFGMPRPSLTEGQTCVEDFRLPRGARLVGRVLDEDGKPVSGATVSCGTDAASEIGPMSVYHVPGQNYGAGATTDAAGRYELNGLTQETYRVQVVPPEGTELAPTLLRGVNAPQLAVVTLQDLRLYRSAALAGEVLDIAGKPIEGAEVVVNGPKPAQGSSKTDAQGRFLLRGLASGGYSLTITPPEGSACSQDRFDDVAVISGYEIARRFTLPAALRVSGKVTGTDGRPLPRVAVSARHGYTRAATAVTDDQGAYTIKGIPRLGPRMFMSVAADARNISLRANPPDELPCYLTRTITVPDAPGGTQPETQTVDIQLQPAAAVTGRVTGPDGTPLAACEVSAIRHRGRATWTMGPARTGADGLYVVGHLTPGNWAVSVQPPSESKLLGQTTAERAFDGGKTEMVDVQLQPEPQRAVVAGRVLLDGKPLAWAQVVMRAAKGTEPARGIGATEDAWSGLDGEFRFDAVPPGTYQVTCTPLDPALRAEAASVDVAGAAERRVDLPVIRMGSLTATFLNAPHGSATVTLTDAQKPDGKSFQGTMGKEGKLRMEGVSPGQYRLKLTVHGTRPGTPSKSIVPEPPVVVTIESGKETLLNNIALPVEPPEGSLALTILDARGKPSWARVRLSDAQQPGNSGGWALADQAGKLKIEDLAPGKYLVTVDLAGQPKGSKLVAPPPVEVTVESAKEAPLSITLLDGPAK